MNNKHVKKLNSGDKITWNDPDDGECSRVIEIKKLKIHGDTVQIYEKNGNFLECFADELSQY